MDQQAAADMLKTIIDRLERRSNDPKHTRTPGEALAWTQAADIVRLEAELAGIEL